MAGKLNGVIFLDIKKPFDSINHGILLNKMKKRFGISSIPVKWFESYLSNREQKYSINEQLSSKKTTTPCMYADDTQIFSSSYDANELVIKLSSDLSCSQLSYRK